MDSYREIENLLYLYAERMDAGDFEAVAELFAHAEILAPSQETTVSGYEEVLSMYRHSARIYEQTGTPCTKHVTTNAIIEVDEKNDIATAKSYFTVFQALEDFPLQPIMAGRYHDRFERIAGKWRFSERKMLPELYGDLSRHLLFDVKDLNQK
jgi:3-phenylpropionate/cinnamic acid dioxygenase small subunit